MSKEMYMCDECYNSAGCYSKTNDVVCDGKAKWRKVRVVELEEEEQDVISCNACKYGMRDKVIVGQTIPCSHPEYPSARCWCGGSRFEQREEQDSSQQEKATLEELRSEVKELENKMADLGTEIEMVEEMKNYELESHSQWIRKLEKSMDKLEPAKPCCASCKWLDKIEFNMGTCNRCYYYGIRLYGVGARCCTAWQPKEGEK